MKNELKISTKLEGMTLRQLMSYANILEVISEAEGDVTKVDKYALLEDLSIIGWGTPEMKHVLSDENVTLLFANTILALNPVFEDYNKQVIDIDFKYSFKVPISNPERHDARVMATLKIDPNVQQLPAEIWGSILSRYEQIQEGPIFKEMQLVPFVLARLAWSDHSKMFTKDVTGMTIINNALIAEKERLLLEANARDAVQAFVFFLTIKGIYSTAPNFLSSKGNLITRISNLQKNARLFQNDGGGSGLSRTRLQKVMTDYSKQN